MSSVLSSADGKKYIDKVIIPKKYCEFVNISEKQISSQVLNASRLRKSSEICFQMCEGGSLEVSKDFHIIDVFRITRRNTYDFIT